jgi:hypothetical protein
VLGASHKLRGRGEPMEPLQWEPDAQDEVLRSLFDPYSSAADKLRWGVETYARIPRGERLQ